MLIDWSMEAWVFVGLILILLGVYEYDPWDFVRKMVMNFAILTGAVVIGVCLVQKGMLVLLLFMIAWVLKFLFWD